MKLKTAIIVFVTALITACVSDPNKLTTESGVKVTFVDRNEKKKEWFENQILLIHMTYADDSGRVLYDSRRDERAFPLQYKETNWAAGGNFYDVMKNFAIGDSAYFKIDSRDWYQKTLKKVKPDTVNGMLNFNVKLENIVSMEKYQAVARENRKEYELKRIDEYLSDNDLTAISTKTGLRIVVKERGDGAVPQLGDSLAVHYRGAFMNNQVFDSSFGREPFGFNLGQAEVITAWDEGFGLLPVGTKATFYVPSALAYGEGGYPGSIPPNSVLKFDIELLAIID